VVERTTCLTKWVEKRGLEMSVEENKTLIQRYYEQIDAAAREKRDAAFLDEFVASDFVNYNPLQASHPTWKG
jgi:ketosteroid isomerase-like protein